MVLPPGVLTPRPRRVVDRRGSQTTTTRKSAPARIPARITAPPRNLSVLNELTATANAGEVFALSTNETPRRPSASQHLQRRRTLDFDNSLSSDDSSDTDSSYNSFLTSLRKKDALRLDSRLRVDELLDRTLSDRGIAPSPSLALSYHSRVTTYRILSSNYEGSLFQNSKLTAQLVVGPAKRAGQSDPIKSLFKWVHVENPDMNFGAYMAS